LPSSPASSLPSALVFAAALPFDFDLELFLSLYELSAGGPLPFLNLKLGLEINSPPLCYCSSWF